VSLTQKGEMRNGAEDSFRTFQARQTIEVARTEFRWLASTGPLGAVKIENGLSGSEGHLKVRLFGHIPLAEMGGGVLLTRGEIMRYLAELAWAPDAMLANTSLDWQVRDSQTIRVCAGKGQARGEIELHLAADGLIASVSGLRPRVENGAVVERLWQVRFSDYRRRDGRQIPFDGEVG
jgi:hypothetical protein